MSYLISENVATTHTTPLLRYYVAKNVNLLRIWMKEKKRKSILLTKDFMTGRLDIANLLLLLFLT